MANEKHFTPFLHDILVQMLRRFFMDYVYRIMIIGQVPSILFGQIPKLLYK